MTIKEFNDITGLDCVEKSPQGNNSSYMLYEQNQTGSGLVSLYEVSVKAVGSGYSEAIADMVLDAFEGNTGFAIRVIDQENHPEKDAEDATIWRKVYFELSEV